MNFSDRSYPYPVLGIGDNFTGDENKDLFKPVLVVSSDFRKIRLDITWQLRNEELLKLVNSEQAVFCTQLYCKSTLYRQSFLSKKQKEIIELKSNLLRDGVDVDFFICAAEDINNYKNSMFSPLFSGISFDIEKGDMLAYGGSTTFCADKSPEEMKSISSFMSIDTENKSDVPMHNEYDGDKITIILSQEDYRMYQSIKKENLLTNTLHSSVVLPALAEAIRFLDSKEGNDYKDKKWYDLLKNLVSRHQTDDPLQTAQKILDLPVNRSFTSLHDNLI
jgi:hypothetical protein